MKTFVVATHDNILIARLQAKAVTDGGIHVPDQSQDRPSEGTIVALGPEVITGERRRQEIQNYMETRDHSTRVPTEHYLYYAQTFSLGDHVMFGKFAGTEITVDDQVFVKIRPDEIFCVITTVEDESEPTEPGDPIGHGEADVYEIDENGNPKQVAGRGIGETL